MNNEDNFSNHLNFEKSSSNTSSYPLIAGILLIITGIVGILWWIFFASILDTVLPMMDLSGIQEVDPSLTIEHLKNFYVMCATILSILSIFPILSGILAIKKKMWGIALTGSILGLFTFGFLVITPLLSLVALVLIYKSRKDFQ